MKIKSGFVLRNICDSYVVIAMGERASEYRGMIKLNDTGAFLWEQLQQERTAEELSQAMIAEYDVDFQTAKEGIEAFVKALREGNLLAE